MKKLAAAQQPGYPNGKGESMRIRQMGFSSRLKAHKNILTLETLKFIAEYLVDGNARQAALRAGIPEAYAARQGQWLKKHPMVVQALERELDTRELRQLQKAIAEIKKQMDACQEILGLDEVLNE
jgi:phage terminase small subunit